MKSFNLLKVNSSFLLVFGVSIVLTSIFIAGEVRANHLEPPPEAGQCRELTNAGEHVYVCEQSSGVDINENSQSNDTGNCIGKCWDNGGITIRTGGGGQFGGGGQIQWYCYGVTDSSKTCNIDNTIINLATGERTEEEKGCSFINLGCWLDKILSALGSLGGTLIVSLLGIISNLMGIIFLGVSKLFAWMIGAVASIPVSPNNDQTVQIVKDGWGISRDIANMFFIIVLSFIGLATILGIESYQAKKTLPRLLIIALLINFSGVLVGFIVDIGNLFTNFFLQKATGLVWSFEFPGTGSSSAEITQKVAGHLAKIIFYMIASLIYLAVAFLFFIRVFFLWTLAILAPLAFAAAILPATKKYWNQWWEQLIQWSLLGVPMAFFIYLSRLALEPTTQNYIKGIDGGANPIASFMGPFIALFLLFFGISLSIAMAPSAAQGVIGGFKKYSKATGKGLGLVAGTAAWRKIKGVEGGGTSLREASQKLAASQDEKIRSENLGILSPAGMLARSKKLIGRAGTISGSGLEMGARGITSRLEVRDDNQINDAVEEAKNQNAENNINKIRTELLKGPLANMNRALGLLIGTGQNGDSNDIRAAIEAGKLNMDGISKIYKTSVNRGNPGPRRNVEKMFLSSMERLEVSKAHQEEIWAKITPQDITNDVIDRSKDLNPETEEGKFVLDKMMQMRGADFMPAIMRRTRKGERDAILKHIKKKDPQWFIDNDATDVLYWSVSSAAQGLGVGGVGGFRTKVEVDEFITENPKRESKSTDSNETPPPGSEGEGGGPNKSSSRDSSQKDTRPPEEREGGGPTTK